MLKAERIYNILKQHYGHQVGGNLSNRFEADVSMIMELAHLQDRVKELEKENFDLKLELGAEKSWVEDWLKEHKNGI